MDAVKEVVSKQVGYSFDPALSARMGSTRSWISRPKTLPLDGCDMAMFRPIEVNAGPYVAASYIDVCVDSCGNQVAIMENGIAREAECR